MNVLYCNELEHAYKCSRRTRFNFFTLGYSLRNLTLADFRNGFAWYTSPRLKA